MYMVTGWKRQTEQHPIHWKTFSRKHLQSEDITYFLNDSPKIPPNRDFWGNFLLIRKRKNP
jgi:hypothetical protein